jgi:hypothetical protein
MKTGIPPRSKFYLNLIYLNSKYQTVSQKLDFLCVRCLIHNAHLGKIPSFCKILDLKITHFKEKIWLIFCLISAIVIQAWRSKVKKYYIAAQNCVYFIRKNSLKLRQKSKWALWMRHQDYRIFSIKKILLISKMVLDSVTQFLSSWNIVFWDRFLNVFLYQGTFQPFINWTSLVSHSQCSLRKNPKFWQKKQAHLNDGHVWLKPK